MKVFSVSATTLGSSRRYFTTMSVTAVNLTSFSVEMPALPKFLQNTNATVRSFLAFGAMGLAPIPRETQIKFKLKFI